MQAVRFYVNIRGKTVLLFPDKEGSIIVFQRMPIASMSMAKLQMAMVHDEVQSTISNEKDNILKCF